MILALSLSLLSCTDALDLQPKSDLTKTNFFNKTSHIKVCKEIIHPSIMNNVIKLGGTTEPIALFKYCSYMKELEEYVKSSKFNIMKIRKKDITSNNYLNYVLMLLRLQEKLLIRQKN